MLLVPACSGDDSANIPTSVDEATPVNELDDDEQGDLCEDMAAWAEEHLTTELFQRLDCIGEATSAAVEGGAVDEAACRQAYDACLARPPEEEIDFAAAECNTDALPMCDVTVGEYLACAEDSFDLLDDLLDAFSCSHLEELAEVASAELPGSCQRLDERCPELFGDPSGGASP